MFYRTYSSGKNYYYFTRLMWTCKYDVFNFMIFYWSREKSNTFYQTLLHNVDVYTDVYTETNVQ